MTGKGGGQLAINWFEGGRRISKLFMGLTVLGGAVYTVFVNEPMATLTTRGPTMPWFVSDEKCPYTAHSEYLWQLDWGGDKRGLQLCFLDIDGRIPYAVAPTPPEEKRRQEAEDKRQEAAGEPPPIRIEAPWFYTGSDYDQRVIDWAKKSATNLEITPELRDRLKSGQSSAQWRAHQEAFNDALPWVLGICAFLWAFTAVMGWIVRGFAGVPSGQDFRPKKQA